MYRIGIDIGGTFTDLVAISEDGTTTLAKVPTTTEDQSIGLVEGLGALAEEMGLSRDSLLERTSLIIHGTTAATNALLERKGARVGMLTTEGFRDVIEMREGLKPERYDLRLPPSPVLVPRSLRLPVVERMRHDGRQEIELDEDSARRSIAALAKAGVEAVAICLLHSYADPRNERRLRELVREQMPDVYISLSSEVLPQIKEFERFSTTVANAFVGPLLRRYLQRLEGRLSGAGYGGTVLIMQSHGGLATIEDSIALGAGCVLSGPAGGIAAASYAADLMGAGDLITFDMGGTSSDIALLDGGVPSYTNDKIVQETRVALPSIDIHTIGAGGGSIARVQIGGMLKVGPESAGSTPGPACYSRGGTEATTTDANVVLGFYDPANFLGGRITFDGDASRRSIEAIAEQVGCGAEAAAQGILDVINTQMAEGIRIVAVRAGRDPRNYALLSFGGAAGLHITAIARLLGITRVIVPRAASVLSAWGMLATSIRYEKIRTVVSDISAIGAEDIRGVFDAMEREARAGLERASHLHDEVRIQHSLEMRYGEQIFEIEVPLEGLDLGAEDLPARIAERFHQRHEELYTYASPDQEVVLVNARLSVEGVLDTMPVESLREAGRAAEPTGRRRVFLDGWQEIPVHDLDVMAPGHELHGPAIVETRTTSVLLRGGDLARVNHLGWLEIAVDGETGAQRAAAEATAPA